MKENFVLIIPNIRSGHNVGALFRTADGAGVDKIYICGYSPVPPHPQVDKVSLGAEKFVSWEYCKQTARLLKRLKTLGYNIIGLEQAKKSIYLYNWKPKFPLAVIVGNEKEGIPAKWLKYCDQIIDIPMRGKKNSLNVSVAGGIILYHISKFLKK
jgi:tRNA G18 (ribose-2'-O)-methylase SpoU